MARGEDFDPVNMDDDLDLSPIESDGVPDKEAAARSASWRRRTSQETPRAGASAGRSRAGSRKPGSRSSTAGSKTLTAKKKGGPTKKVGSKRKVGLKKKAGSKKKR
jgi:hypothetical protein